MTDRIDPQQEAPVHDFDEALISGYLDGELTQGDRQRVALHIEGCSSCRRIADDLAVLRQATMATTFAIPDDTQWDERPRTGLSRLLLHAGFAVGVAWAVVLVAVLGWQLVGGDAAGSESGSGSIGAAFVLAPLAAIALIVLSALADRLRTRQTDPYRQVKK